jgi:hypothetical protein
MGWKSTITLTREEAIQAILLSLNKTPFEDMTNIELEEAMYRLGIGDEPGKPYYGHNFIITDVEEDKQEYEN